MLFGSRARFAIDCEILSLHPPHQAAGKFVVWLSGLRFGVDEPNATMLGNSIDTIEKRLRLRGQHQAPWLVAETAVDIANDYLGEVYRGEAGRHDWDRSAARRLIWAPDGDEAFDDSSHILQIDSGETVRLIAFRNTGEPLAAAEITEFILPASGYYSKLSRCLAWYRGHFAEQTG